MVFRGRGNPGPRGYPRPFRARGRGRRPFPHRGQKRGGFGRGDEGLRITLRNPDRGRRTDEGYEGRSHDYERDRCDDYEDYRDDFDQGSGHEFEEGNMFDDELESSRRDSPARKRQHTDSDFTEEESLRITVGNDIFREEFSDRRDSPHTSTWDEGSEREKRWEEDQQEQSYSDRRHSREDNYREGSYDRDGGKWEDKRRGRGRGYFRPRGFDPNYRGRGRGRGDFRGGFRGRGWGNFDPHEHRGRGFYKHFERGRGRGGFISQDRHPFDDDCNRDSHRRRSLSRERSRSNDRYSHSPLRRRSRSRSYGRGRSPSPIFNKSRRSYSRGRRSYSRNRSRSPGRRSFSRGSSHSRGRRSPSRGRSLSRERSYSRGRRLSRRRSLSRGRSRSRKRSRSRGRRSHSRRRHSVSRRKWSHSSSRSYSGSRHSSSRSRSPIPIVREASRPKSISRETRPKSMGREIGVVLSGRDGSIPRVSPHSRSVGRSLSQGRELHSQSRRHSGSSSSSSSHTDSPNHESLPMSEEQYEEEMYRRLKSEINSSKDPKEREESIAVHIRDMAKLSPFLFRQFMAKNAGNLSAMALLQPNQQEQEVVDFASSQAEETRPLRSILKRKDESRSPSPDRNPSPPQEQSKSLSQIEKVIQALRKGGSKPEEPKPAKKKTLPPPLPSGALGQLSSYMDIEEEEEYLYGDGEKQGEADPKAVALSGPFWSAHRFEEKQQTDIFDMYDQSELLPSEESSGVAPKGSEVKIPSAFSSLEEKEKSYEQWRASVFQKPASEKPKECALPVSNPAASDSAEQLSSTVENILKSIGFNFELSQRMQELARQKKEEEQDAIKINQSASFLGADPDALAEDLSNVFQKEEEHRPEPIGFMKEIEAAKKAARERAQKAKEAEERRVRGRRNPSTEEEQPRESIRDFPGHYERTGYVKEEDHPNLPGKSRKISDTARTHSPYDPSIQDYYQRRSLSLEQQYSEKGKDVNVHEESSSYVESIHHARHGGLSSLISLGSESRGHEKNSHRHDRDLTLSRHFSDTSPPDFERHDKDKKDIDYKKAGDRILIVRKKEEKGRSASPGSENIFSRRIVLPPKEKNKAPPVKSPNSDSQREGKKRLASPDSPRQSKYPRRSPSHEDLSIERKIFQKSKSTTLEESKGAIYKKSQEKSHSPDRLPFDSKFKYQEKQGSNKKSDVKVKSDHHKSLERSSKSDSLKTKGTESPESKSVAVLKEEVKAAAKSAESKAQWIERKRQLVVLERELDALRQQHNELLRKRRRHKDGHRDPLIVENTKLQTEIAAQIRSLRKSGDSGSSGSAAASSTKDKSSKSDVEEKSKAKEEPKIHYEYFDPGSHWCSSCNVVCGHMIDFLKHVESKKHQQKLDPFSRPWLVEAMQKQEKKPKPEGQVQAAPIKGLEFMMATSAFYCSVCKEFCGDLSIAESHMKSEEHHNMYNDYLSQHPYYEKRYMLERSAALSTQKRSSPVKEDNSPDSDSDTQKSTDPRKRSGAGKSDSSKLKEKDENWKEKILGKKTLYADYEEDYKVKFEARDREKRRYRGRSRDKSRERADSSRDRRASRDGRGDTKEHLNSKDKKEDKNSKEKEKRNRSDDQETVSVSKTSESSKPVEKPVDASGSEIDQKAAEGSVKEETTKDLDVSQESEGAADEAKEETKAGECIKPEVDEKKDKEMESKGKIPIKLTGKSGIKPSAALPPWKMFTRPIPKSTSQKRLLTPRPQQAASTSGSVIGPSLPNEDPAPLDDFLTVGVRKTVPVVSDASQIIEQPPDPKVYRKGDSKAEENRQMLKEMEVLGIDPSSLMPLAKPKPPPPPSQNLSLPPDRQVIATDSSKKDLGLTVKSEPVTSNGGKESEQPKTVGPETVTGGDQTMLVTPAVPAPVMESPVCFQPSPVAEVHPYSLPPPVHMPPPSFSPGPSMMPVPNTSMPPLHFATSVTSYAPGFVQPPYIPPPLAAPVMVPAPMAPLLRSTPPPQAPPPPPPPPPPPLPKEPVPVPPPPPSPPKAEASPDSDSVSDSGPQLAPEVCDQPAQAPSDTVEASPTEVAEVSHVEEVSPKSQETPATQPAAEASPPSQVEEAPLTSQVTEVSPSSQVISVPPTNQTEESPLASQVKESSLASQVKESPPTSQVVEASPTSQVPIQADVLSTASGSVTEMTATEITPIVTATISPCVQSETTVTVSHTDTHSSVTASATEQISAVVPADGCAYVVSKASASSAVETLASSESKQACELTLDLQPQPSSSAPEVASLNDSPELTSPLAVPLKRPAARRGRGGRKAVVVHSMPAEQSGEPEASNAPAATPRRPRTRSQMRQQPRRQTRSRTRQQRSEEEEESVTASDEADIHKLEREVGSPTVQEAGSPDGNKASSTSACVLDLTSPPADCSGGGETNTEVTSSSSDVKTATIVEPPSVDSALNLTIPPEIRGARQEVREQTMPEDLSSYAQPQDLSTTGPGKHKGGRLPEMPIDLTMRLVPSQVSQPQTAQPQTAQPVETQPSPGSSVSTESVPRQDCLVPQAVKDTLLSSTSAGNPSASNLSELEMGDEGDMMEDSSTQIADSAGLGVDPEGELVDFSLAAVDFEELVDIEMDETNAGQPEEESVEEKGDTADSTIPKEESN